MKRLVFPIAVSLLCVACGDQGEPPTTPSPMQFAATSTEAATDSVLHVPRDYATIQAAVNAAPAGATIQVRAGVYTENVVVRTAGLRLHASNGVVVTGPGTAATGIGISVLGTAAAPVADVEISGFEVTGFKRGIIVQWATRARIHHNDAHHNREIGTVVLGDGVGIELVTTSDSEVTVNSVHHNGQGGIFLRVGSTGNTARANRVFENGDPARLPDLSGTRGTGIMLTGAGTNDNRITDNEILQNYDRGIVISRPAGQTPITGNVVAQNRIHGSQRSGITIMAAASGNSILDNDARDNNLSGLAPCYQCNLHEMASAGLSNIWEGNLGTFNLRDDCARPPS